MTSLGFYQFVIMNQNNREVKFVDLFFLLFGFVFHTDVFCYSTIFLIQKTESLFPAAIYNVTFFNEFFFGTSYAYHKY